MTEKCKSKQEEECDCALCARVRKMGYANPDALVAFIRDELGSAINDVLAKHKAQVVQRRVVGHLTPEDAKALESVVLSIFVDHLLNYSSQICHRLNADIGTFVGGAAKAWNNEAPRARLIPISEGDLSDVLQSIFGTLPILAEEEEEDLN